MKKFITILAALLFAAFTLTAQTKQVTEKLQVTGLKNAPLLKTDEKGNVVKGELPLPDLSTKLDKGEYDGTAEDLKAAIDNKGTVKSVNNVQPDENGNIAIPETDLSNLVPYTGATKDINLGDHAIFGKRKSAGREIYIGASGISLGSYEGHGINISGISFIVNKNSNNMKSVRLRPKFDTYRTQRQYILELPDKSGTLATEEFVNSVINNLKIPEENCLSTSTRGLVKILSVSGRDYLAICLGGDDWKCIDLSTAISGMRGLCE